jgi:hypothetical protein
MGGRRHRHREPLEGDRTHRALHDHRAPRPRRDGRDGDDRLVVERAVQPQ